MARTKPIEKIRNIGIIAHIDAGKTTTTERILFYTGVAHKIGSIDEGTTITDWMEQERERGITITAATISCTWIPTYRHRDPNYECYINIIDTPGHIDFTAEVQRSLRVLDGAVVIFDGVAGVEPQSETVWRQADRFNVPRICFINKMDRLGANYEFSFQSILERLTDKAVSLNLPIGLEDKFEGVIDLLEQKEIKFLGDYGQTLEYAPIRAECQKVAAEARHHLIEKIVETDDRLLAEYLEGKEPSLDDLRQALRQATISGKLVPVFCGASFRNKGVQPLLDAIVEYLPSPLDLPPVEGLNPKTESKIIRRPLDEEPLAALAFKVANDPYVGTLTYLRVYSGHLTKGSYVYNATKGENERISRLIRLYADKREDIDEVWAGDIAATVGLKNTSTGDTLCDSLHPIILEKISFPEPVISVKVEPKTKQDQDKISLALHKLAEEDPTFKVSTDPETLDTIISGMGELHLEIIVDRLKREFNVEVNTGRPQVAYKETIKNSSEAEGKYIRQSGGRGQYGHVLIKLEPLERGKGFEFVDAIKGGVIPQEFIPAVEKGIKEAMEKGILAGYPMVDLRATLYDGSYHEVDSSDFAFKIAGSIAFQEAAKRATPVLLEPIMKVEVTIPEKFLGDIIGDLNSKRGRIERIFDRANLKVIDAFVPLAEMFGYATRIRSLTEGRGSFNMEFSHYEEVPKNITETIMSGKAKSTD